MRLWMNWVSHMDQHRQGWQKNYRWFEWGEMDSAPQQHPKSHGYRSAADLTSCTHTAVTVFTRPHTLWLLALLGLRIGLQSQCFATLKDTKCIATGGLCAILKEAFHECFQICQTLQQVCVSVHAHTCTQAIRLGSIVFQIFKYDNWITGTFWDSHVWFSEKRVIISLKSIKKLLPVTEMQCFHDIYELILNYYVYKFQASKGLPTQ